MDLYSILGQQLSVDEALPPETAPAAAALSSCAQPSGAESSSASDFGPELLTQNDPVPSPAPSNEEYTLALRLLAEAKLRAFLASAVERVRYITNASGIALALSENEEDAMVCHASSGPAAPEVGARMYIRSGITSESLRTRQTLRCDRASTDLRVNQESCKALGIESVLVMPVILNRNVVGMFQLFGARPSAFSERDATTLRASIPQVESALQEAVDAGMPLGHIPWAEEVSLAPETPRLEEELAEESACGAAESLANNLEETETVTVKMPVAFPIDAFRRPEPAESVGQTKENEGQEVPAFLARLADEGRPAPNRTWSQWFRPQW